MLLSPYRLGKSSSQRLNNLPKVTCGRGGIWTQVCLIITYYSPPPIKNNLLPLICFHSNPYSRSQKINLPKISLLTCLPSSPQMFMNLFLLSPSLSSLPLGLKASHKLVKSCHSSFTFCCPNEPFFFSIINPSGTHHSIFCYFHSFICASP